MERKVKLIDADKVIKECEEQAESWRPLAEFHKAKYEELPNGDPDKELCHRAWGEVTMMVKTYENIARFVRDMSGITFEL